MKTHKTILTLLAVLLAVIGTTATVVHGQETRDSDPNAGLDPLVVQQMPLSNAADKIYALWLSDNLSDFGGLSFADDNSKVILYWKEGQLPPAMSSLVTDLRNTVTIEVVNEAGRPTPSRSSRPSRSGLSRWAVSILWWSMRRDHHQTSNSSLSVGIDTNVDEPDADKLSAARQAAIPGQ